MLFFGDNMASRAFPKNFFASRYITGLQRRTRKQANK
jgi:hypothetical protein